MRTGLSLVAASGLVGVFLLGRTLVPDPTDVPDLGDPVVLQAPAVGGTVEPDESSEPNRPGSIGNGTGGSPAVPTGTALPRPEATPDRVPVPVCSVHKDYDEQDSRDRGADEDGCVDDRGADKKQTEEEKKAEKKAKEERKKAEKKAEEEQKKAEKKAEEEQKKAEKKAEEEQKKTGRSDGSQSDDE